MTMKPKVKFWLLAGLIILQAWNVFAFGPDQGYSKYNGDPTSKAAYQPLQSFSNRSLLPSSVLTGFYKGRNSYVHTISALPKVLRRFKRAGDRNPPVNIKADCLVKHIYSESGAFSTRGEQFIKDYLSKISKRYPYRALPQPLTIVEAKEHTILNGLRNKRPIAENTFKTDPLPVMQITFNYKYDTDPGTPSSLEVMGEKLKVSVVFMTDGKGIIKHLHEIDANEQRPKNKIILARYTADEGFPRIRFKGTEKNPSGAQQTRNREPETSRNGGNSNGAGSSNPNICGPSGGIRKKRSASGCVMQNGDLKQFVEQYTKADLKGKEEMAEMAKRKLTGDVPDLNLENSLEYGKKVNKLIQLEEIKAHARAVDDVNKLQITKSSKTFAQRMETLSNEISTIKNNVQLKLSSSKVAQKLSTLANAKSVNILGKSVGAVSKPLGHYFLGKAVIQGIVNGDEESLAIIGARLGYEGAVWAGGKYLSSATKLGKVALKLGKLAGPIGGVIDIGLSVYSIYKSVNRLNSATNQYERNDAIADIVSESVEIAATAVVVGLSLAFPPAAPIIATVGIVFSLVNRMVTSVYQAQNEVNRMSEHIKLLESEERAIYINNLVGFGITESYDYLNHLIEEKQANDLAVKGNLDFLRQNENVLGVVFPSRTMYDDGSCTHKTRYCKIPGPLLYFCAFWSEWKTVGTNCDWRRRCSDLECHGNCMKDTLQGEISRKSHCFRPTNEIFDISFALFDPVEYYWNEYACECDSTATSIGYPRKNSLVDFRKKQSVYLERVNPEDVGGANFKCKPSSKISLGHKVHEGSLRNEYLCENAIAILQPPEKRKYGQIMMFDLEDGNDTVFLNTNDSTPSLFKVGATGTKEFHGGGGKNEFVVDSNNASALKGKLIGGPTDKDVLIILNSSITGMHLKLDFGNGSMTSIDGKLNMQLESIENFYGRHGAREYVVADCHLRKIMGRGGNENEYDIIRIPRRSNCAYNLKVGAAGQTQIISRADRGDLTLIVEKSNEPVSLYFDVYPDDILKLNLVFEAIPSNQVVLEQLDLRGTTHSFKVLDKSQMGGTKLVLNFAHSPQQNVSLHFNEGSSSNFQYSSLVLSLAAPPRFYHTLTGPVQDGNNQWQRLGNQKIENMFQISGPNWHVVGGEQNDEFILISPHISSLKLEGGVGDDTLSIQVQLPVSNVDLRNPEQFRSIENVRGLPGSPLNVICACETKLVMGMGGSHLSPDRIMILQSCDDRDVLVVAQGHSKVVVEKLGEREKATITVVGLNAPSAAVPSGRLQFELENRSEKSTGLVLVIQLSEKVVSFIPGVRSWSRRSALIRLEGRFGEIVQLALNINHFNNQPYLSSPQIQFSQTGSDEPPTQLLIDRETLGYKMLWNLIRNESSTMNETGTVSGYTKISNSFQVVSGSWQITGGDENDTFIIFGSAQSETISVVGGSGKENVLVLEKSNFNGTYSVNLPTGEIGFLHRKLKGQVQNIAHILGRKGQPDSIWVDCNMKSVNGRGGARNSQEDFIFILNKGCANLSSEVEVFVAELTKVKNTREFGVYNYQLASLLHADLELAVLSSNRHLLKFSHEAWGQIEAVGFNKKDDTIDFKVKAAGKSLGKTIYFKMIKETGTDNYYNPTFELQALPHVKADLHIGKDGATIATTLITGIGVENHDDRIAMLPVNINRFVIKISDENLIRVIPESQNEQREGIFGRSIVGSKSSIANQFWILELNSPLLTLDGGSCDTCTNYLNLGENLEIGKNIEITLRDDDDIRGGSLESNGKLLITQLRNIHNVTGRKGGNDSLALFSCNVKQISGIEHIIVNHVNNCSFNIVMEIGESTEVSFENSRHSYSSSVLWEKSTFHYHFSKPVSFDPSGDDWIGPSHYYYLSFNLTELESMSFDLEDEILSYIIGNEEYSHSMLIAMDIEDQFYTEPQIVMNDGFKVNIGRDGSILLVKETKSHPAPQDMVLELESTAAKLGITIMLQAESQMFYVGHKNVDQYGNAVRDRNVLQSSGNSESHLVGDGMDDTIYEITSLQKDVLIYTGFETEEELTEEDLNNATKTKQTIDLTDIVAPIRMKYGTRYVPSVTAKEKDILIEMQGYLDEHPGKIWIVNGTLKQVAQRLQLLFNNAMMDLVPVQNKVKRDTIKQHVEWKFRPRPILISEGMVYSFSPEDLEDNHQFRVATNLNATFQTAKHGTDLYLTNVAFKSDNLTELLTGVKATTVIISDIFEHSNFYEKIEISDNSIEVDDDTTQTSGTVKGVTISAPGLRLLINDSKVVVINNSVRLEEEEIEMNKGIEILTSASLPEWDSILMETEEKLLIDMPDIPRVFAEHSAYPLYFILGTGLFLLTLLVKSVAIIFFARRLKSKLKGEYALGHKKHEPRSQNEAIQLNGTSKFI